MSAKQKILSTKPPKFKDKVKNAPLLPGCYFYKDTNGENLYIGKAKVLRNRVRSYFNNYKRLDPRIRQMIDNTTQIDFITVDSEAEALILETNLIKKYQPKYNIMMRDDKSFVYVRFDAVHYSKDDQDWKQVPSISVVREKHESDAYYFGPYPSASTVRRLLKRLRKIFPYCTSNKHVLIPKDRDRPFVPKTKKPCFQYHIDLCEGVCIGEITRGEYENQLNSIKRFFRSEKTALLSKLEEQMQNAAEQYHFEKAAKLRDRIKDLKYVGRNMMVDKDIDDVAIMQAKKKRREAALNDLVEKLEFPEKVMKPHQGFRIECYDISNTQGTNSVGSMVVFENAEPKPSMYRRFKIKHEEGPNDFAMLQEVLIRRFNQLLSSQIYQEKRDYNQTQEHSQNDYQSLGDQKSTNRKSTSQEQLEYTNIEGFTVKVPPEALDRSDKWTPDDSFSQIPDLLVIDGGKGQLSACYQILQKFGLEKAIPIIGLAKRDEEIFKVAEQFNEKNVNFDKHKHQHPTYVPVDGVSNFQLVRLPRRSASLHLMQRIRDEAHRFAVKYHRKLRSKQMVKS